MTREAFLGIDLGTASLKAGLIALDGSALAVARSIHGIDIDPATGRAEQDAETWWSGLRSTLAELRRERDVRIVAIGIAGHGPTTTPVDPNGRPVGPAMTWLDSRAGSERDRLEAATGLRGWSLGVLPAALRLEHAVPGEGSGVIARPRWYLNSWEALGLRLTGVAATSLVPGQPFPDADTLVAAGLDPSRIAPARAVGTVLGDVTAEAAADLGLAAGTPVVAGLVDAFASFHGAGMVAKGDAIDVGGAAGGFGVYWDRPLEATGAFSTPAPLPGLWSVGGAMAATGSALEWLAGVTGVSVETILAEAALIKPGADGLVFLPYLAGERSPLWDPAARGVLSGLTLVHGRAHIGRAVLESAALAIRHVAAPILAAGATVAAMRVCGGPAQSDTWNRIKADVTGFPVAVPHVLEATVLGAAIVAAVGVGRQPDLPTAIRSMTAIDRWIEPDPGTRARYDAVYDAYVELWPALRPVLEREAIVEVAA